MKEDSKVLYPQRLFANCKKNLYGKRDCKKPRA